MLSPLDHCREEIAKGDRDRYRLSLFAPPIARPALWALYAFHLEIAKIADQVREPMLGLLRLTWWRESLDDLYRAKRVPAHGVLQALEEIGFAQKVPKALVERLLDAREADLEVQPFLTSEDLYAYLDGTSGTVFRMAFCLMGEYGQEELAQRLGRIWGLTGLLRTKAHWQAKGRSWFPREEQLKEHHFGEEAQRLLAEQRRIRYRGPARSQLLYARQAALYLHRLKEQKYEGLIRDHPADIWRMALAYWSGFLSLRRK